MTTTVHNQSIATGEVHAMDMDLTPEHAKLYELYGAGFYRHLPGLIQDNLSYLTDEQREFLMTGITPEEWEDAFGEKQ